MGADNSHVVGNIVGEQPLRGWTPILVLPVAVVLLTPPHWPRWALMWLLAFALFAGLKWLTWRRTPVTRLPWWRHAGYLLAWPGLDAKTFLSADCVPDADLPTAWEWSLAGLKTLVGIGVFWSASWLVTEGDELLLGWLGMMGFGLMFHFGVAHLLSCAWRAAGVEARPLMNNPFASVRVSEFWGQRWNTAFRDVTHRFLFRPLTSMVGPRWGIAAGFLFSGLVHDLVISVPAGGGYGGPTLFFMIQAAALFGERSRVGKAIGLGHGWRGWVFTMVVLGSPALGLFHPPFVINIVVPFMKSLGAA